MIRMEELVLVIDDERNLRTTLSEILRGSGYEVAEADNSENALESIRRRTPDLILCDWRMPGGDGESFLRAMTDLGLVNQIPIIVMTAHGTGSAAMMAIRFGAYDFLTKPLDFDELLATVRRALDHARLQREVQELRRQRVKAPSVRGEILLGASRPMLEVYKAIGRVASTDATVLLLGESGSGKELAARTIHLQSQRADKPFVIVNCAALPAELLESELFGHEKGAFTGAIARKPGKFESAAGGTVFLDEVGELPLSLQPKLLRVLQEHTFERLGSNETIHSNFRVIAATNRSLEKQVSEKQFRPDLFYRLQAFTIQLPPLRERRTDILPLAEHFAAEFAARNNIASAEFSNDALLLLQQYGYPGNVRELEHIVERAMILSGGRLITADVLRETLPTEKVPSPGEAVQGVPDLPFHESVAAWERQLIQRALAESNGNKAQAARRLGIQRRLLYEKLKILGLETDRSS
jgi:DNA-binding NtrC family response regulator